MKLDYGRVDFCNPELNLKMDRFGTYSCTHFVPRKMNYSRQDIL